MARLAFLKTLKRDWLVPCALLTILVTKLQYLFVSCFLPDCLKEAMSECPESTSWQ